MARLYANENFALPAVLELRRLGHDVLTTHEAGRSDQSIPDDEVLQFAHAENRLVLTLNRKHFIRLHREGHAHSGIIVCTYDPDFPGQAARIHETLEAAAAVYAALEGILLRVNRPTH